MSVSDHQFMKNTGYYPPPLPTTLLLLYRGLFGMGYTQTLYTEDGRRVTSSPEEVRRLNVD